MAARGDSEHWTEAAAQWIAWARAPNHDASRGLTMHFAGWAQPLEAYVGGLESAGFAITSLREPTADLTEGRDHMSRWSRFPLFLWLKARALAA